MKRLLQCALLLLATLPACATTWYVNPTTGGTRYSATNTSGQCNGQSATPYVSGTNQPCPYNDFRYLWNDPTVGSTAAWVISGGDTIIISGYESSGGLTGRIAGFSGGFCPGLSPCNMPSIPSGSSGSPTRILGANFASCGTSLIGGDQTKVENMVADGSSAYAIAVNASQWVDIECLNVNGEGATGNIDFGVFLGNVSNTHTAANITFNNTTIQGFINCGFCGSIAGLLTLNDTEVYMNASAGLQFDDGNQTPSTGSVVASYLGVDWNGCLQEWPITHAIPVANGGCRDDNSAGYGDGWGTPPTHMDATIDHSRFSYNTQDGFDSTHASASNVTVTNSNFFGNMGGNIKIGAEQSITEYNNTVVANCQRMIASITGAQTGYNTNLSDFCRASGDQNGASYMTNAEYVGNAYAVATQVTGTDTHFLSQLTMGDMVAPADFPYTTYERQVTDIVDDTHLSVLTSFPTDWGSSGSPLHLLYLPTTPASSSIITIYHDTDVGYGQTVLDGGCGFGTVAGGGYAYAPADSSYCSGFTINYKDNINVGILNTVCGSNPGCGGSGGALPGMWAGLVPTSQDYNSYFNLQSNSGNCVGSHDVCSANPLFVSQPSNTITAESQLDNYNFNLSGSSILTAAGVAIGGQTADQTGISWASPPSMGALQYVPASSGSVVLGGGVVPGGGATVP